MIKIGDDNIITSYITKLLTSFDMPNIKTLYTHGKQRSKLFEDSLYIKYGKVVRCAQNGSNASFTDVCNYDFGRALPNMTRRLKTNNLVYNAHIHKFLGDYLRFLRDYKDLDLMSMYNCFSGDILLNTSSLDDDFANDTRCVYAIPVKFSETYTIALSCKDVKLKLAFYDGKTLFVPYQSTMENRTILSKPSCDYFSPFIYSTPDAMNKYEDDAENYLVLLMSIPMGKTTNIVVCEGDYTYQLNCMFDDMKRKTPSLKERFVYTGEQEIKDDTGTHTEPANEIHGTYYGLMQLFNTPSSNSYAFADNLVQYIMEMAVTNTDKVKENIYNLQKLLRRKYGYTIDKIGVFDDKMRDILYTEICKSRVPVDTTGYLSKDIQKALMGSLNDDLSINYKE